MHEMVYFDMIIIILIIDISRASHDKNESPAFSHNNKILVKQSDGKTGVFGLL